MGLNFQVARIPIPSGLNIAAWHEYLHDYSDNKTRGATAVFRGGGGGTYARYQNFKIPLKHLFQAKKAPLFFKNADFFQ